MTWREPEAKLLFDGAQLFVGSGCELGLQVGQARLDPLQQTLHLNSRVHLQGHSPNVVRVVSIRPPSDPTATAHLFDGLNHLIRQLCVVVVVDFFIDDDLGTQSNESGRLHAEARRVLEQ